MSVFWNKNDTTRQLLHGSTVLEVPASGGSGNVSNFNSTQIFDVNNDIDCLGDMYLELQVSGLAANARAFDPQYLTDIVKRVEFQVGTQIWQTLENQDLMGLAATEMSEGVYKSFSIQTSGLVATDGSQNARTTAAATSTTFTPDDLAGGMIAYVPLKMFTKTLSPELQHYSEQTESGYLMAAAPNQQVKIKVYLGAIPKAADGSTDLAAAAGGGEVKLDVRLFAKNIVMCNEEREQMKAMPMGIPKRIKTTQNALRPIDSTAGTQVIDIDHFSLYASHLLITFPKTMYTNITGMELLLNSSSFSGELPISLLEIISSSMNLYNNNFIVAGGDADKYDTVVFPLASRAYSGSGVPLNRFDNIRLKIKHLTNTVSGDFNITCVGETTALYKNGAASLAMY